MVENQGALRSQFLPVWFVELHVLIVLVVWQVCNCASADAGTVIDITGVLVVIGNEVMPHLLVCFSSRRHPLVEDQLLLSCATYMSLRQVVVQGMGESHFFISSSSQYYWFGHR